MRGKGIVLTASVGIVLLSGIAAGLFLNGQRARAGQIHLEEKVRVGAGVEGPGNPDGEGAGVQVLQGTEGKQIQVANPGSQGNGQNQGAAGGQENSGNQGNTGEQSQTGTGKHPEGVNGGPGAMETGSGTQGAQEDRAHGAEITMLFAGDVYFSNHVLNAYDKAGGIHGVLDEGIRAEIDKADIFMVNQEFPFTQRGSAAADKQFTFRLPENRMHLLQEMGVDIVTLANNHILDFGEEGLLDSCKALDEAGIPYVGGGENLERAKELKTMVIGNKTIGFLGMSRVYMAASWAAGDSHPGVFSTYDTTLPLKAIAEAREACDYLVVYVHWGVEREKTPKDYQRAMGRAYIDAGADLVVGSHPHVLQETEIYNGKPIVYSLGNFVFGSSIPETALLKVVWNGEEAEISMIPCTSSGGYTRLVH